MKKTRAALLEKLQALDEVSFARDVLQPLFTKLDYDQVDFHHGPYELGRDHILIKSRPLTGSEITVVQVKMMKFGKGEKPPRGFPELVSQLEIASETPIDLTTGERKEPDHVLFITPYILPIRIIEERPGFRKLATMRRFKIIDGSLIADLLEIHLPDLVMSLIGPAAFVNGVTNDMRGDLPLLRAIGANLDRNVSNFYCDLNFTPGRDESHFFFDLLAEDSNRKITCLFQESTWRSLQTVCEMFPLVLELDNPIEFSIAEAWEHKTSYVKALINECLQDQRLVIKSEKIKTISDDIQKMMESCERIPGAHEKACLILKNLSKKVIKQFQSNAGSIDISPFEQARNDIDQIQYKYKEQIKKISKKDREAPLWTTTQLESLLGQARKGVEMLLMSYQKSCRLYTERFDCGYKTVVDRAAILNALLRKRQWLEESIDHINSNDVSPRALGIFMDSARLLFEFLDLFESVTGLVEAISGESINRTARRERPKIRIPLSRLFDCGRNLSVFGEAGAGKTTSLNYYAISKNERDENKLRIFVPLSEFSKLKRKPADKPKASLGMQFLDLLNAYFQESEYRCSLSDLQVTNIAVTLLLDGLDEAAKTFPWLIEGINEFSKNNPKVQIIVSSRLTLENLKLLPFLGVTIRPFTDHQQELFIRGILKSDEKNTAQIVIEHLRNNEEIRNVTRNPLLATVLCQIAQSNARNLPKQESRLYEERLDLFISRYDPAKGISRVESDRVLMREVARRIAFHLHIKQVRSGNREELSAMLKKDFRHSHGDNAVEIALSELRDPCNILVEMNYRGDLGFGHLRFQEHLVAEELGRNPDEIISNIGSEWWFGPLYLWAQTAREVIWLAKKLATSDRFDNKNANRALERILVHRSPSEIAEIDEIFDKLERQEEEIESMHFDDAQRAAAGLGRRRTSGHPFRDYDDNS